jgi:glucose/arabinose dehydrogenase
MRHLRHAFLPMFALIGCAGNAGTAPAAVEGNARPFTVQEIADFDSPWAMTFTPDGQRALITEKAGKLKLWQVGTSEIMEVAGLPQVDAGGQGGLGDVVLHPNFAQNGLVYISFVEAGQGDTRGAAVGRGRLVFHAPAARGAKGGAHLDGFQIIWRQSPKVGDRGHFGHRLAFGPDRKLYISNGDRQLFDPAQDMAGTLGKIVRLNDDGTIPADNPFASRGGATAQIWSLGHRNPLGLAFAPDGRLWSNEMGPRGGDEFNRIERGSNYGYPIVSDGDHYDSKPIPDHATRPEFNAPEIVWTPVINPSSLIFYTGKAFPRWRGSALIGGLGARGIVRVEISGDGAREAERFDLGARIREVEQGPDGTVYVLEDERGDSRGRLLKLSPTR